MSASAPVRWRIGDWQVAPELGELSRDGQSTKLDQRAMRLLMYLAERPGQVVSIPELLDGVWGKSVVTPSSVYEAIASLRQVLKDPTDNPEYIVTLPRRGYRLIAAVECCSPQTEDVQPSDPPAPTTPAPNGRSTRLAIAIAATAVALAVIFTAIWFRIGDTDSQPALADKSIAVLPFLDLSERRDQAYLVDGLAEQLLDVLANVPGLRVISRTSSFQFRDRNEDMRGIGAKLGVAYLVEGSLRRNGNHVRVVAQLIRTSDGAHQWSATFDREIDDILQLESDLASSLGRALELSVENAIPANPVDTRNAEANDHYLRGLYALDPHTRDGIDAAAGHFEAALLLDPQFAAAQVALARTHYVQLTYGFVPGSTGIPLARESITTAVRLNPRSAVAHAMLARIATLYDWNWAEAQRAVDAALALAPSHPFVLYAAGDLATVVGDFERAEKLFRASLVSDPLNPETHFMLATLLFGMHRADEAAVVMQRTIAISPDFPAAQVVLANIVTMQGREDAVAECEKVVPEDVKFRCLAKARYQLGQVKEAEAELAKALRIQGHHDAFWIAAVYAFLGDPDRTFEWLERAYAQKEPYVEYIKSVPEFDQVRGDPRYRAFLAKMRLPN